MKKVNTIETVLIVASLTVLSVQGNPPPPAIGDIRLVPYDGDGGYYEVLIYYSDGESKADFGGVCADNLYQEEAIVICHQLGYQYSSFQFGPSSRPVWFKNIQCDTDRNTAHILRCHTSVTSSGERNSPTVCGPNNHRLLVKCDLNNPLEPYDGQVSLCPVDITSGDTNISSTSYGLVGIYYKNKDYGAWKGINQKDGNLLGAYEADAICRQMGFTGAYPGTAVTRNVDNCNFSNCFRNRQFQHAAWVTTSDISCQEPQKCLGCCLNYSHRGTCGATQCDEMYNLVIRCAFDPSKIDISDGTAGSESDCKLDNGKNVVHQCELDNSKKVIKQLKIALGIVIPCLLLMLVPCACYGLYRFFKDKQYKYCTIKLKFHRGGRKEYERLGEDVQNNQENARINQIQDQHQAA